MQYILTGAEMAACDARTTEIIGIPSLVLMERAALSVADGVEAHLKKTGRCGSVLAFAGKGNNGADALAAGRILLERGYEVAFYRLSGRISPESSFAVQEKILGHYEKKVEIFHPGMVASAEAISESLMTEPSVVIDGLFGTGLSRPLAGEAALAVWAINTLREKHGAYVVAVDIPSGISSDDGSVMGCAVRCDETRTFAFFKRGHFLYPGASYAGTCHLSQIGITPASFAEKPGMIAMTGERPSDLLPARDPSGNKGTFGKILIAAGRRGMCGAAIFAAHACMAAGAGMVKLFTHEANRVIVQQMLPEALLETWTEEETEAEISKKLCGALDWADVAAAGPGMGTDEAAKRILHIILDYAGKNGAGDIFPGVNGAEKKKTGDNVAGIKATEDKGNRDKKSDGNACCSLRGLVLDADAIRLLAGSSILREKLAARREGLPCILTPHLAEFAALAQTTVKECVKDRARLVQEQADLLRCTVVCKDARTLAAMPKSAPSPKNASFSGNTPSSKNVKFPENDQFPKNVQLSETAGEKGILYLNTNGNSGMATAGSGDVLTGMTAAILALFIASRTKGTDGKKTYAGNDASHALQDIQDAGSPALRENPDARQRFTLQDIHDMELPVFRKEHFALQHRLTLQDIPDAGLHGFDAACTAVWLHGLAGDAAWKKHGAQGMTARDLIEALRESSFWE